MGMFGCTFFSYLGYGIPKPYDMLIAFTASPPQDMQSVAIYLRWIPHPVIVTIRDNKDHIRVP